MAECVLTCSGSRSPLERTRRTPRVVRFPGPLGLSIRSARSVPLEAGDSSGRSRGQYRRLQIVRNGYRVHNTPTSSRFVPTWRRGRYGIRGFPHERIRTRIRRPFNSRSTGEQQHRLERRAHTRLHRRSLPRPAGPLYACAPRVLRGGASDSLAVDGRRYSCRPRGRSVAGVAGDCKTPESGRRETPQATD